MKGLLAPAAARYGMVATPKGLLINCANAQPAWVRPPPMLIGRTIGKHLDMIEVDTDSYMAKITGSLSPEGIKGIKIAWVKKFGGECPFCKGSIKDFGIQVKDDLFYCKKCLKYHIL